MDARAQPLISRSKVVHGLKEYAGIALYLYVCFAAILFYRTAVLESLGIAVAPYGLAAAKALILAKFMLLAQDMHAGDRYRDKPLIFAVLYKSVIVLLVLVALSATEDVIVSVFHARTVAQSVSGMMSGQLLRIVASCVLIWLILLPYLALRQIDAVLGKDELRRMLFGPC